jgi:hypothetical protein
VEQRGFQTISMAFRHAWVGSFERDGRSRIAFTLSFRAVHGLGLA